MSDYKIIKTRWFSDMSAGALGAVAIDHEYPKGSWKAYLGMGSGADEYDDQQTIAAMGAKLMKDEACALFPTLDPDLFIY